MADEDVPEEGGLEPADTEAPVDDAPADAPAEPEAEPETYTRDQLAELLPHFDQFATHEGVEAFRKYGESYGNARSFISSGGHREPQDEDVYRGMGIDPPPAPAESEEEPQGLWGTPWQEPTTWEEVQAYANTEDPNARRLAAMAVMRDPNAPDDIKSAYFSHWAAIDPAGATAYSQQATMTAAEQRLADLEARLEAKFGATHEDLLKRNGAALTEQAKMSIPGFVEHGPAVSALMQEQSEINPQFPAYFYSQTPENQMKILKRFTLIAAAEAEPARKAAQAQAAVDTEAAKQRAQTETSRTSGQPDTAQSAAKRKSLEDARRVGHRVF